MLAPPFPIAPDLPRNSPLVEPAPRHPMLGYDGPTEEQGQKHPYLPVAFATPAQTIELM